MTKLRSIDLIAEYLLKRGYELSWLNLGYTKPSKHLVVTSPTGNSIVFSAENLIYPFNTTAAKEIINNKTKTYDFARSLAISTPKTMSVYADKYDHAGALNMLNSHKKLIVKPHNGLQARGLTLDVTTEQQLHPAIQRAAHISNLVLIQEQFTGEEVRFITVNGIVRAAILRQKAQVIGDGSSTIAELIKKENADREKITTSKVPYPLLSKDFIDALFFHDKKVLPAGEVLKLSRNIGMASGASFYNILSSVDQSYVDIAQSMVKKFGKGFVTVDLMAHNFQLPAEPNNYILLELNSNISLPMCYSCRDGKHFKVLEEHLGPILEQAIN